MDSQQYLVHPAHQVLLDVQGIQDKDLLDHLGLQVSQVMEDQDLREREENQALFPALEHIKPDHKDHLDHLGLLDLKDQQVLLDQEDTKVSRVCQASQGVQEALRECQLMVQHTGSQDHQVHQGLLEFQDRKDLKETLEHLVSLEGQSLSRQAHLVPRVLLVLQAILVPLLLPVRCASTSPTI